MKSLSKRLTKMASSLVSKKRPALLDFSRWPKPLVKRSEEHTSELQSLRHLVCRLLLDVGPTEIYTLSLHDALPIWLTKMASSLVSKKRPALLDFSRWPKPLVK